MSKIKHLFSWEMQATNSANYTHRVTPIPFFPKKCVKPLKNPYCSACKNNQVFITGKFNSTTAKSLKQMKYEASLFPDLPESRLFSQQPGRNYVTFHKNSLTQVNRCPRFVQVPFECKWSWNPLKKINSYKRRAVFTTLLTI